MSDVIVTMVSLSRGALWVVAPRGASVVVVAVGRFVPGEMCVVFVVFVVMFDEWQLFAGLVMCVAGVVPFTSPVSLVVDSRY